MPTTVQMPRWLALPIGVVLLLGAVRTDGDAQLVGHWPLNGNAQDGSGNGLHGSVVNAVAVPDRFGVAGGALGFDGTSAYVQVDHDALLSDPSLDAITFAVWMRSTSSGSPWLLAKGEDFSYNYGLFVFEGQPRGGAWGSAGGSHLFALSAVNVNDGDWHHIAVTVRKDSIARIFVDGVLTGSMTAVVEPWHLEGEAPLLFGTRISGGVPGGPGLFFDGALDDVRIYRGVLADAEIAALAADTASACTWCGTVVDFAGDTAPTGWSVFPRGAGAGIALERATITLSGTGIGVRASGPPPPGTVAIEFTSTGTLDADGLSTARKSFVETGDSAWVADALVGTFGGVGDSLGLGPSLWTGGYAFPDVSATSAPLARISVAAPRGAPLRISSLFRDDSLIVTVRRAADSAVVAIRRFAMPGFALSNVTGVAHDLHAQELGASSELWFDDLTVTALTSIPTPVLYGASVHVSPDSLFLESASPSQLTATVEDLQGDPLPGAVLTWESRNPAVVTVDGTGLLTPTGDGGTWVLARSGPAVDSTYVNIEARVGHWNLDGGNADASGNGNGGAIEGVATPTADRFGTANGALHFDGVAGRIRIPMVPTLQVSDTDDFTAMLWFRADAFTSGDGDPVLFGGGSADARWSIRTQPSGDTYAQVCTPAGGCTNSSVLVRPTTGTWQHAALRVTGGTITLFLNGTRAAPVGFTPQGLATDLALSIGGGPGEPDGRYFHGALDDARFYKQALTDATIRAIALERPCAWCGETITFEGDSLPTDWATRTWGGSTGVIQNGRLESPAPFVGRVIRGSGFAPSGTTAIELTARVFWDDGDLTGYSMAMLDAGATTWSALLGNGHHIVDRRDGYLFPEQLVGAHTSFVDEAGVGALDRELLLVQRFKSDSVIVQLRNLSDSAVVYERRTAMPGFRPDEVDAVRFAQYATAGSAGVSWADDVRFTPFELPPPLPAIAASIELSPDSVPLSVGAEVLVSAVVRDASNAEMSGAPVSWLSRQPAIASVNAGGYVTGVAAGSTWIVATSGPVSDSVPVTVEVACVWCSADVAFDGDSLPTGWTAATFGSGPGAVQNNRLEAFATDRGIAIRAPGAPTPGTVAIEVTSVGPLVDDGSGLQRNVFVETGAGAREAIVVTYSAGGPPAPAPNQLVISANTYASYTFPSTGTPTTSGVATASFTSGDTLRITRLFKNDSVIVTVRNARTGALVDRERLALPGFNVADATAVVYYIKYSASSMPVLWVDDISVRALTSLPSEVEPIVGITLGDSVATVLAPTDTLSLPLNADLTAAAGRAVSSVTLRLSWNPAVVHVDSLAQAWGALTITGADSAAGFVEFTVADATATPASVQLATAHLRAVGAGSSAIAITALAALDGSNAPLLGALDLRGHTVCASWAIGLWGDLDGDGEVNSRDAQQLARFAAGLGVANAARAAAIGDVNEDAVVDAADALAIARFVAGVAGAGRTGTPNVITCP